MFIVWLLFCGMVAFAAKQKGRSPLLWGLLSFIISPLLAGVGLAMVQDKKQEESIVKTQMETQQLKDRVATNEIEVNNKLNNVEERVHTLETTVGVTPQLQGSQCREIENTPMKQCPECGQWIKQGAIKCRYCEAEIPEVKLVECPYCKELIRSDAIKCKFCRSELNV